MYSAIRFDRFAILNEGPLRRAADGLLAGDKTRTTAVAVSRSKYREDSLIDLRPWRAKFTAFRNAKIEAELSSDLHVTPERGPHLRY
jgi:hypothetical protein